MEDTTSDMDVTLSPTLAAKEAELEDVETQLAHMSYGSRTPATWISKALDELHSQPKGHLDVGIVLIILDINDFSKACRVHAYNLFAHTRLRKACEKFALRPPHQGIENLLVLEGKDGIPVLVPRPLSYDITSASARSISYAETTRAIDEVQPGPNQGESWSRYYDIFLRIISGRDSKSIGISRDNLDVALRQITALVDIANAHHCDISMIAEKLMVTFHVYGGRLYTAVGQDPIRWCKLGMDLQDEPLYKEAFIHLVGAYDSIYGKTTELPSQHNILPLNVQGMIAAEARELKDKRMNIDLLLQSMSVLRTTKGKTAFVSHYDDDPAAYDLVNLFRDYMTDHIRHLRWDAPLVPTYLCSHTEGCNTVAGFYRLLSRGKHAYMRYEDVMKHWNMGLEGDDAETVKSTLKKLKETAKKYVQPLVVSHLQASGSEELHYLTCVKVEAEDYPWLAEGST
ncbi:hypothetical protein B0A48_10339 [Cryoendolithus antarcticus]|uniref:Uncharacterized protein n=1 Tax=Cryoendolithus antarcticus TaxID=1507870 RepID=A0A1V8SX68_9PEZI|nr:hypothetical protein B0A48_10339 [Cryoendolithus antarcticus]